MATSVVEEGVDIPQCNLVVRFDEPGEFRSYVQSKGRARAAAAHYLLLVTRAESEKLLRDLADYHVIERRLTAHCLEDSEEPAETDMLRELAERRIPPYRPASAVAGAMVTRNSAIALVNRSGGGRGRSVLSGEGNVGPTCEFVGVVLSVYCCAINARFWLLLSCM